MLAQTVLESRWPLLEDQTPTIDLILRKTIRRRWLQPNEADEFRSFVYRRLLDNQCSILRKHRGESSWKTYLTVVTQRLFLDYRDHVWGKWRPSAKAKRAGRVGILLDRLLSRDGYGVAEAIRLMRENHDVEATEEELWLLAATLPQHGRPKAVSEDFLAHHASTESAEAPALASEKANVLDAVLSTVEEALEELEAEDRLILKMRFFDQVQICQIARVLGLPAKPLYRRIEGILRRVRKSLEGRSCHWRKISWLFQP